MNCNDNHIALGKYLEAMLRVSGPLKGLPIVEVSGHTDNAINCNNNHLGFDDFVKLSIGSDSCGKPAIRVKYIDSCDTVITCATNNDKHIMNSMFAYDSTAKTFALVLNKSE